MYNIVVLLAGFAAVTCNDIQVGTDYGRLVSNETIVASPAIWQQTRNYTVNATENEVISRVLVTDERQYKDGSAKIVEGGVGHKNVTIELMSPTVFRGFAFHVVVFAVHENSYHASTETKDDVPIEPATENKPIEKENEVANAKTQGTKDAVPIVPPTENKPEEKENKPIPATNENQDRKTRDTETEASTKVNVTPVTKYAVPVVGTTELPTEYNPVEKENKPAIIAIQATKDAFPIVPATEKSAGTPASTDAVPVVLPTGKTVEIENKQTIPATIGNLDRTNSDTQQKTINPIVNGNEKKEDDVHTPLHPKLTHEVKKYVNPTMITEGVTSDGTEKSIKN